jgi:gamma-glutamylcyclotransferase
VLFDVPHSQVSSLALAEGEGTDYDRRVVWVEVTNGELVRRTETYIAQESKIDQSVKPYDWYLDLVITGALMHELPQTYVDAVRKVPGRPDLDLNRPARLEALKQLAKLV